VTYSNFLVLPLPTTDECADNASFVAGSEDYFQIIPIIILLQLSPLLVDALLGPINVLTPFTFQSGGVEDMTFVNSPGNDLNSENAYDVFYTLTS